MDRGISPKTANTRRKAVTFTVRPELLAQARELGLNASRAAELGLESQIKTARETAWLKDNADAIAAHNQRIADSGLLITPHWTRP